MAQSLRRRRVFQNPTQAPSDVAAAPSPLLSVVSTPGDLHQPPTAAKLPCDALILRDKLGNDVYI